MMKSQKTPCISTMVQISVPTLSFKTTSESRRIVLIFCNFLIDFFSFFRVISSLMSALNIGIKAVKDISKTWRWILIGLVEVTIITIMWIYLLQHIAFVMTWITIIALLSLNAAGVYFSFEHYKSFDQPANHTVEKLIQTRSSLASSNPNVQFRSMSFEME